MSANSRPRLGLLVSSVAAAVVAIAAAVLLSAWALIVVPFALIVGVCAYQGFTLSQTWDAIGDAAGDDAGRGPAGLSF